MREGVEVVEGNVAAVELSTMTTDVHVMEVPHRSYRPVPVSGTVEGVCTLAERQVASLTHCNA